MIAALLLSTFARSVYTRQHFTIRANKALHLAEKAPASELCRYHLMENNMDVLAELEKLRMNHNYCEDCWYSCPKAEDGCCDDTQGDNCNCGADEHNAILDSIIKYISDNQQLNPIRG
jgi:hypothetical protein